ncbi:MAG: hypothetical protein HQL03_03935 [Nitrospirae bacterium]|nr:hypothetical protein [Nitrospirota bacterium]
MDRKAINHTIRWPVIKSIAAEIDIQAAFRLAKRIKNREYIEANSCSPVDNRYIITGIIEFITITRSFV